MNRSLIFFFWTVWSSVSVSRRSVREHAEPSGSDCVARMRRRLRSFGVAERSERKKKDGGAVARRSVSRPRRAWAWRGMFRCRDRSRRGRARRGGGRVAAAVARGRTPPRHAMPGAKRRVRLPRRVPRRAGWAPAALGPDIRRGSTPLRTDPSRPIDHFEVRGAIAVVVFDVILELRDRHIVVPIVQQGLPLLLRSVVHDDEPVREGLHRRIAVPLG